MQIQFHLADDQLLDHTCLDSCLLNALYILIFYFFQLIDDKDHNNEYYHDKTTKR